MKQSEIEVVIVIVVLALVLSLIFFDDMILGILTVMYAELYPHAIVFAPDVDISKIDASQILNCLHSSGDSGGCPAGVTYVNDDTGEVEEREIIPNQQQPVEDFSPESQGIVVPTVDESIFNPTTVEGKVNKAYIIYILIVAGLAGLAGFLIYRWKKMKET